MSDDQGDAEFAFSIDLTVRNEWRNVDLLRTSVQNCFIAVFADLEACQSIAMVTGELLENALKYGDWANAKSGMFRLRVVGKAGDIEISVSNPLSPSDPKAASLMQSLEWIASFPRPELAYRARLLQIAQEEDMGSDASRVGLVRIAFEGNCRLAAKLDQGNVTVTAVFARDAA